MIDLSADIRLAVESVIRERLGDNVKEIEIEVTNSGPDDIVLLIRVKISSKATASDFSGRFFGLTGRVRNALGDDLRGVFPVIRPVEAHA